MIDLKLIVGGTLAYVAARFLDQLFGLEAAARDLADRLRMAIGFETLAGGA